MLYRQNFNGSPQIFGHAQLKAAETEIVAGQVIAGNINCRKNTFSVYSVEATQNKRK
jgi:hypothetical protein